MLANQESFEALFHAPLAKEKNATIERRLTFTDSIGILPMKFVIFTGCVPVKKRIHGFINYK